MRSVMIPSETKHSDTIIWEQLWYPWKHSTAIPYYYNSYDSCSHNMALLCFVSEGIINVLIIMALLCIVSEGIITVLNSNVILWEQLWYPWKQSTAIPYYENSYDTLGNKAQRYHTMRTVMIPSEAKHSNTILWEQVWYRCALFPRVS
jgi:hypothetical protein